MKFDGFRALAHVTGHHCQLVSPQQARLIRSWIMPTTSPPVIAVINSSPDVVGCSALPSNTPASSLSVPSHI